MDGKQGVLLPMGVMRATWAGGVVIVHSILMSVGVDLLEVYSDFNAGTII